MLKRTAAALLFLALLFTSPVRGASSSAVGSIAPFPKHQFFDNNGNPAASYQLFTYAAGTSTKTSTYTNVSLSSANTNPIVLDSAGRATIFLPPGVAFKFVFASPTDTDPPLSPIWTVDNVNATRATELDVDVEGIAGETLSRSDVVYLSDGSGGKTAGRWYKGESLTTYSSTQANAVGIMPSALASGATGTIRLVGRVIYDPGGLAAGGLYSIGPSGSLLPTGTPLNDRPVAVADGTGFVVFSPWVPIADATATLGGKVSTSAQTFAGLKNFSVPPIFNAGGGSGSTQVSGRIHTNTTAVGNVGAGEDDLMTFSLPAGSMSADGNVVRVTAWGTYAANANAKTVKMYFGATAISSVVHSTNAAAITWRVTGIIARTGAATQDAQGSSIAANAALIQATEVHTAPGETLSGAVTIKVTGEATSNNDVVQEGVVVEVIG